MVVATITEYDPSDSAGAVAVINVEDTTLTCVAA